MDHFRKLKAKFESLTTHDDHGAKKQSTQQSGSSFPEAQTTGAPQQDTYPPLWQPMIPTSEPGYPSDSLGPGGFFIPPLPQQQHQQQQQQQPYGDTGVLFPGSSYPPQSYPPYPPSGNAASQVYDSNGGALLCAAGAAAGSASGPTPYPPGVVSDAPPVKSSQAETNAATSAVANMSNPPNTQEAPRGQDAVSPQQAHSANSIGRIGTFASAQVPSGVPLPLDQHDIVTTTAQGDKQHVTQFGGGVGGDAGTSQMLFLNIANNETVHQRFLIVYGQVPGVKGSEDRIVVRHPYFPPLTFPAVDGYFKTLVELESGDNGLKFEYLKGESVVCQSELTIKMDPYQDKPPLLLAIIMASDSKGTFDAPPDARGPGLNDLDAAIRKFRCCAYLWQAFMAEQMYRQGFGRRTFRLEESYEPDTMARDNASRMTARVHVVKSKRTVAEIRDKERAQQWSPPPGYKRTTEESQFGLANDALNEYGTFSGQHYVACLSLDSCWDASLNVILGHAALGGGVGERRLGVFGSHTTHAWPANAEEVAAKFLDTTKTDTRYLANDCNECGEYWRAANIGMGAFLHECGHLLTLAHTPSGIMRRGFNDYNRTFMAKASNFDGPVRQRDEAGSHWHRTDIIRLRHHPCLRLPSDPLLRDNEKMESGFEALPTENGILIQNDNGITIVEVWVNDKYRNHREYTAENLERRREGSLPAGPNELADAFPRSILLDMTAWREWAGGWKDSDKVTLELTSRATATDTFANVNDMMKAGSRRDRDGCIVFCSGQLGKGEMQGTEKFEAWFSSKEMARSTLPKVQSIQIYSGNCIDGFILRLDDGSERKIGACKGGKQSTLHIDPNDDLDHVVVRSGWWIDGLEFVTSQGHSSGWKGGSGGGKHMLKPPVGYCWMGLSGSGAGWLDSLTMHYAKRN
ncbi:hypothetical protein GGI04_004678 [Coemansia thaxteri]|nr:hypothetical protein GGI04_004678 [Coemansia thaxteri]